VPSVGPLGSHVQAPEHNGVHSEEITRQQALRLSPKEGAPGGVQIAGSGPVVAGAEDPADGRLADMAAKAGQFAVDAGVTPSWVLPCQPQHQPADLLAGRRPARPSWIGPFTREKMAVPGQPGSRRDEPTGTQQTGPQPGYRCQDRAVGPVRLRPGNLAPEHHHFVTEHDDLRVLGRLATAQQDQPHEDPGHDQVQQTDRHKPRSCRNSLNLPNHSSRALRRVLERYTPGGRAFVKTCTKCREAGWPIWIRLASPSSAISAGNSDRNQ